MKDGRKSRFLLSGTTGSSVTDLWTNVDPEKLILALNKLANMGVSITFAPTRDKGAMSVTLVDDGNKTKAYPTSGDEMDVILESISLQADIAG